MALHANVYFKWYKYKKNPNIDKKPQISILRALICDISLVNKNLVH